MLTTTIKNKECVITKLQGISKAEGGEGEAGATQQ